MKLNNDVVIRVGYLFHWGDAVCTLNSLLESSFLYYLPCSDPEKYIFLQYLSNIFLTRDRNGS